MACKGSGVRAPLSPPFLCTASFLILLVEGFRLSAEMRSDYHGPELIASAVKVQIVR